MFFTLLTFFFFTKPYFTAKRETLRVSLLYFSFSYLSGTINTTVFTGTSGSHHFSLAQHSLMRRIASRMLSSLVA